MKLSFPHVDVFFYLPFLSLFLLCHTQFAIAFLLDYRKRWCDKFVSSNYSEKFSLFISFLLFYWKKKNVMTTRSRRIDSEINFVLEREGWFGSNVEGKIYEEQAFSQLKHTASPPFLPIFFYFLRSLSLSLSCYPFYLATQREKLRGGKLLSACSCISRVNLGFG